MTTKSEPGAWKYNWNTLSQGAINTETWSSRLGVDASLTTLLSKKITLAKSKKSENQMV
jgi:hypothetical protein